MEDKQLEELKEKLRDRRWRLTNLYYIKDSNGRMVKFSPNETQWKLHDGLHYRNIVPKARKLGVSTFFCILALDQVLFASTNKSAAIIAHRNEDVKKMFRNVIMFAVEHFPDWVKEIIGKADVSSANEIVFKNGGTIFVSLTTRSGTPQFLHVSEFGYICKHFPERAAEIITGAINSVAPGNMISIESTSEGKGGDFYEMCMTADSLVKKGVPLTEMDFKLFFFPWYEHPDYILRDADFYELPQEVKDYFEKLERVEKIFLPMDRKRWYGKKFEGQNRKWESMWKEYPSTLEESFRVSLEGAYYSKEVNEVYKSSRVGFFPYDPRFPVDTAWDIGVSDSTSIVFHQNIGPEIRIIDGYQNSGEGSEHYMKVLRERGYRYGRHVFPHDIGVQEWGSGATRMETLVSLGLTGQVTAPKLSKQDGIDRVRLIFSRVRFDQRQGQVVLDALQTYRKKWDDAKQDWASEPVHDKNSHWCDAVRYMAVMYNEQYGMSLDHDGNVKQQEVQIESVF
jgi:hypothetical protein